MCTCPIILLCVLQFQPAHTPDSGLAAPPLSDSVFPEGTRTEKDYAKWLTARHLNLLKSVEHKEGAAKARVLAYHANWTLAVRCEPQLTRLLLGVHSHEDLNQLASMGSEAWKMLTQAYAEWPADDEDGREQTEMLRSFARAYLGTAEGALGRSDVAALTDMANELAIWIDAEDPAIADAAALWQSLLYHHGGKTDRAWQVLPLALAPVRDRPAAFYLRILRCCLLAQERGSTLALALLLKLEEQCADWFSEERDQNHALCTLTWLRLRLISSFDATGGLAGELTQGMRSRAEEVLADPEAPCRLLRLHRALPVVFVDPEAEAPAGRQPETVP